MKIWMNQSALPNNSLIPGLQINVALCCKIWTTMTPPSWQKLSCSSSGVPIDSPHMIVFSNGTTIILRKMGPVHTILLAKQCTHSRAPNKCRTLQDLDDDDTAFLAEIIMLVVGCPHRFAACDCVLQWYNYHPAKDGTRTYHPSRQTIHSSQALIIGRKVNFLCSPCLCPYVQKFLFTTCR